MNFVIAPTIFILLSAFGTEDQSLDRNCFTMIVASPPNTKNRLITSDGFRASVTQAAKQTIRTLSSEQNSVTNHDVVNNLVVQQPLELTPEELSTVHNIVRHELTIEPKRNWYTVNINGGVATCATGTCPQQTRARSVSVWGWVNPKTNQVRYIPQEQPAASPLYSQR